MKTNYPKVHGPAWFPCFPLTDHIWTVVPRILLIPKQQRGVNRELKIIAVFSSSLICTADFLFTTQSWKVVCGERGVFSWCFYLLDRHNEDHLEASISDEASEGASKPKDYLYPESCRWVLIEGPNSESQPAFHLHPPCFVQRHR